MKKLDIIIPAYNAHKTIEKTLLSILMQNVKDDITVTIVDDKSNKPYDEIINRFSPFLNINLIVNDTNSGPGTSRQNGVDNTNNPYIMFLDSDDLLFDIYSIENLIKLIEEKKCDFVEGLIVNYQDTLELDTYYSECDTHGKIYSRKFIKKYNLKFTNTRSHEDNYYNRLFITHDATHAYSESITYVYHLDVKNSIINQYDSYFKETMDLFLYNMLQVVEVSEKNKCQKSKIAYHLLYVLIFLSREYFYELDKYGEEHVTEKIKPFYKKYQEYKKYITGKMLSDSLYTPIEFTYKYNLPEFLEILEKGKED